MSDSDLKLVVALFAAAWSGDETKAAAVLARMPDVADHEVPSVITDKYSQIPAGATPLHVAVMRGQKAIVKLLLQAHADVESMTEAGASALHMAVESGEIDVAYMLLRAHADPNETNDDGRTALHLAAASGRMDICKLMLKAGARAGARDYEGNAPLHLAAEAISPGCVRQLIKAGESAVGANGLQRSPMHLLCIGARSIVSGGQELESAMETARALFEAGADPNVRDRDQATPLDLLTGESVEQNALVSLLFARRGQWNLHHVAHQGNMPDLSKAGDLGGEHDLSGSDAGPSDSSTIFMGQVDESDPPDPRLKHAIILGRTPIVFGRDPSCDQQFKSRTMSRKHFRIDIVSNGYAVKDLGSFNGTQVNGSTVTTGYRLKPGHVITAGIYEFEFDGKRLLPKRGELTEQELREERFAMQAEG